ncbi:ABC transporter ATP-binding protein [Desertimonas flava]|uniref:ABC transporter ATP-binding protein n=1 Tax=Desertimonas flava TaxID=2064846 RepID=UPI000E34FDC6|nr:ABC transporter ATP-binding protein [Desertimonas flava]
MSTILAIEDLQVHFTVRRGGQRLVARAVDGVDLEIAPSETLGLVGESGSGKSTTGRAVLRLVDITAGSIRFGGVELDRRRRRVPSDYRKRVQVVFQDPYSSLNPRMTVGSAVADPARRHLGLSKADSMQRARELFDVVGLDTRHVDRLPHEFSGGQRQRIAIARALSSEPELIVCDEAVSALDVSTQAQVLNLLRDLRVQTGVAYLFIAHDLDVVRHVSDRISVMYLGRIVETGPAEAVATAPRHPYTELLHDAIPLPDPAAQAERRTARRQLRSSADPPSPLAPPTGCSYHPRCPFAMDICRQEAPTPTPVDTATGAWVRCHLHTHGPVLAGAPVAELIGWRRDTPAGDTARGARPTG